MPVTNSDSIPNLDQGPYTSVQALARLRWQAKNLKLRKAKAISRPQSGSHLSKFRGRGMEFAEVRVYQPGDDVRSIDWRVTARRQTPHTKLFNEERERPLLVICDQSKSQFFGSKHSFKSVRAAEAAALFAWSALDHNDRVGGIVFSDIAHHEVKPARSRKSVMQYINFLSQFNQALNIEDSKIPPSFSLDKALIEAVRLAKPGTLIVIISDFLHFNQETEKALKALSRHNELLFIRSYDPLEEELPPPGLHPVSDGQQTLLINSNSAQVRSDYSAWATQHKNQLEEMSKRFKSLLINLSTHQETSHCLQEILRNYSR
ncbi:MULTISPECIES: DUF58 domain-containing protein [unclassified Oleiphilus]|jgi:uncharacterized protein (DUF58 family)|uniref:DUF58 domain-containing protein n=1 Tax=unclassified Oleiphilus TaxID=2631174 RepID=UPI0007C335D1|nr:MULTISPECIES: DUF58 domain-containing protein [unclassified Oleiphilus]KZY40028.1 hypothetical protein A3732_04080 [Oleiphilus sp. HI0050]KZY73160.1 hypothetical protein A3740_19740 [Oleiphilus sp. HI0068]KZY88424.1 hypothetical protein A3741_00070 [Oleiphilus sp. HI0069]KZY96842.1 hypothetical protein A3743_21690 [Oleiphilus sp. HI0072]KZZ16030.1 hypothetical protein A3749_04795 [Oleiphilus sp. HI0078]KZZ22008.1 hypothetical protein A3752_07540 [Oleiphilus sp. HI0081]